MSVRTKLSIAFSITAVFLLVVGIAAIFLINQLNPLLEQQGRYSFQLRMVADTITAMRLQPTQAQQHLARLTDLENWAGTSTERDLIRAAREELTRDRAQSGAIGKLEQLGAFYRDGTKAAHEKLVTIHRRAVLCTIFAIGESVVLLIILMFLVREWLLKPALRVQEACEQLAAGNLREPVAASSSGEFADISKSLNKVAASCKDMTERTSRTKHLASIGEGCTHISHSMRNLFNAIHSLAQNERKAPEVTPDARAAFQHIMAMTDTLDRWARELMHTGRTAELRQVHQQIEPVIHDTLSMLGPSITEKAIKVEFEPRDDLPAVHIDRTLFEQALLAIIANAIDASPRKGQLVVLAEGDANGMVSVSIKDEGDGIPNDIRQKVFDQFFSTKPKAVGLGLTIAHRIVTLHGGRIEIDSQPDQGTRVRIHLPASTKH